MTLRYTLWPIVLVTAFAIRFAVAWPEIELRGDAVLRYDAIARNLQSGHGFSRAIHPPFIPDDFDQPGYPYFVAGIYWLTSGNPKVVVILQLLLEIIILLLVVKISRRLGFPWQAQMAALIFGLLCPFLPIFGAQILTEVLATFAVTLTCYFRILAATEGDLRWWLVAGISSGLCLLVRPDLLISLVLMTIAACILSWPKQRLRVTYLPLILSGTVIIVLIPWMARNYRLFGKLQPLGGVTTQVKQEYAQWLNTWMDDPKYHHNFWWHALDRDSRPDLPETKIPEKERSIAERALIVAKEQGSFEGYPSQQFAQLTVMAKNERPFQVFVTTPLRRIANAWLRMPGYVTGTLWKVMAYLFWFVLLIGVGAGLFRAMLLRQGLVLIPLALILGRSVLPWISALGVEPRYLIESLPMCFVLAGYAFTMFNGTRIERMKTDQDGLVSQYP